MTNFFKPVFLLLSIVSLLSSCTPNNESSSSHVNINQIELLDHINYYQSTKFNSNYHLSYEFEDYYNIDGVIKDYVENNTFYVGMTYTYCFYCFDKNDNRIIVDFDVTNFVYDEEYISIKEDPEPDEIIKAKHPCYYITTLKPADKTNITLKIGDVVCSFDVKILDYEKCKDVRMAKQLEAFKTGDSFPSMIDYVTCKDDYMLGGMGPISKDYSESFFENNILLRIYFFERSNIDDIYYDTAFIDQNDNLHFSFKLALPDTVIFPPTWYYNNYFYYLFEIPKEYMNKICFSYSPVFNADFPIG